ncbi:MAG TPA: hypothetical protein DCX26_10635 [Pseudomonas sp.]|jgi:hypothetical protein|uniref:hypothetical protein n=1 Tax=Stutzerimonas stutzeri group TaxID=136846 RepID=UPI000C3E5E5F|nr:hypothetical protein [Stutzerimonas kunmingensis]MBC04117.1 hypothetical protein [Phycisphaerae bacterium]PKM14117.1 MAG: hypothetical protein CVV15_00425 [Gammaproteobacteria bacterium HGW-Gammaproteobacteria-5]HAF94054.1 hypothetical protein [Pseudomonas sp.]UIP34231.1 hypothetical protein LW136_07285 [Stutzerimonas kunmingensis]HAW62756.1 hypothetical protein [Pseudomonas sp.]|tara:strand:+ start:5468 stop:5980 length:513 start_codon:yes stop_codon:yes gene_type:complete
MALNLAASSLIMATLAMVGDYSVAAQASHLRSSSSHAERPSKPVNRQDQRRIIEEIRDQFNELDGLYAQAIQATLKRGCFDAELFERLPHHISMTRALEAALRGTIVQPDIEEAHMGLRRSVAKVRGRLVQLENLLLQAHETPDYFESDIDMEGLKALADHSTRHLAKIA